MKRKSLFILISLAATLQKNTKSSKSQKRYGYSVPIRLQSDMPVHRKDRKIIFQV